MTDIVAPQAGTKARLTPALTEETISKERQFRLRKWQQIREAHAADTARQQELAVIEAQQRPSAAVALAILDHLARGTGLDTFRAELQSWARNAPPGHASFNGVNGQMFINQLVNIAEQRGEAAELTTLLADALQLPADEADCRRKIESLVSWVETVKRGAHPAPARVPFVCSFFWALRDHLQWPCLWASAEITLRGLGWLDTYADQAGRYLAYRALARELAEPSEDISHALYWFTDHVADVGLDPTLVDRCDHLVKVRAALYREDVDAHQLRAEAREATWLANGVNVPADGTDLLDAATSMARSLVGDLAIYGRALADRVAEALGRSVKVITPPVAAGAKDGLRSDGWVEWRVAEPGAPSCGLGLWVTETGVYSVLGTTHGLGAGTRAGEETDLLTSLLHHPCRHEDIPIRQLPAWAPVGRRPCRPGGLRRWLRHRPPIRPR